MVLFPEGTVGRDSDGRPVGHEYSYPVQPFPEWGVLLYDRSYPFVHFVPRWYFARRGWIVRFSFLGRQYLSPVC